ncbi:MAG: oxygen-dependent coproporphyrinogen oxidase [Flavobacteriales bacterium]|nr:oxygen-dependent coproporphyrinogen oxidase [Flavobacteriales bacterium]
MPTRQEITSAYQSIQDEICSALAEFDGKGTFREDSWNREGGGGGRSRVMRDGAVIEKGGVNFSEVHGVCSPQLKAQLKNDSDTFFATGVSIVLHPNNPPVPIIHMNIRYFELSDGTYWFGGGIDLTPHYIDRDEARFFHEQMKGVCDRFDDAYYPKFKDWADNYFYLPHRNETRGIGGIFFDDLGREGGNKQDFFDFACAVGRTFAPTYIAIAEKKKDLPFTSSEKEWQLLRRGRYVEFNLVHDRGTRFGLISNGRTESILMSLPATANWEYMHEPEEGSREAETLDGLRKGINYLGKSK